MSEKRFTDTNDGIYDNQEKRLYKISAYEFFDCETDEVVDLLNEQQSIIDEQKIAIDEMITDYKNLEKENEMLKKWLLLYDEDEVDKYLRTHPMPTTTITNKRKVIPLNMSHKW